MDWQGFTALASSLALNGALAWRILRRSNTEAAAGDAATETAREEHASDGWRQYADRLAKRLDRTEKKADDAAERDSKCQAELSRMGELNRHLVEEVAELRADLRALKNELAVRGVRADSHETEKPKG